MATVEISKNAEGELVGKIYNLVHIYSLHKIKNFFDQVLGLIEKKQQKRDEGDGESNWHPDNVS